MLRRADLDYDLEMKVSITHGGTIVPVLTTTESDGDALAPAEAAALGRLVEKAAIGSWRAAPGSPAKPDGGGYSITVDDAGRRTSVSVADADLPPETRRLVDFISKHPRSTHGTRPLGSVGSPRPPTSCTPGNSGEGSGADTRI